MSKSMKPNSDHALEFVDDYLHGVLSADEAERLEQHCDGCSIC
ncbi:MAG: zf-HC2 domain-containing protein, partial [Planctomycetales bacterium]|nr:zf-HC2 domain-containing protein [Planctomycetales bacterium]